MRDEEKLLHYPEGFGFSLDSIVQGFDPDDVIPVRNIGWDTPWMAAVIGCVGDNPAHKLASGIQEFNLNASIHMPNPVPGDVMSLSFSPDIQLFWVCYCDLWCQGDDITWSFQ